MISSTSTDTTLQIILQKSTDGSTWQNVNSINTTFERRAANTVQSIALPFQVLYFNADEYIRFILHKPSGESNHTSGAGIISPSSSVSTKLFRISYLNQN